MEVLRCIRRQLFCQGTCYGQGQEAGQGLPGLDPMAEMHNRWGE